jgi:hypothetical protein
MSSREGRSEKIQFYAQAHDLLSAALERFPRDMWQFRPAPDLWTVQEIILHITDSEANSFVRARRLIAEPGQTVLGYDEVSWASALDYHSQSTDTALELFRWLRRATADLIRDLPDSVWTHTVTHTESGQMTMDDWLDTYARHIPDHIAQMESVFQAWLKARAQ